MINNSLSVIVIGKNESKNIPQLASSIYHLRKIKNLTVDFIYIDSASNDNSVEVASQSFNKVIVLNRSKNLNASAGRYVGVINSTSVWNLFLDADMTYCDEFSLALLDIISSNNINYGYIGNCVNIAEDCKESMFLRNNNYKQGNEVFVRHFGGAVLLPREVVLKAGNYNPSLFSNEEIDLYTRLRANGIRIKFVNKNMVYHVKENYSKFYILIGNLIPTSLYGKKYYGIGQVLNARIKSKNIMPFIRFFPYPFVFLTMIIFSLYSYLYLSAVFTISIFTMSILYLLKDKGLNYMFLYLAFIPQSLLGWWKYDSDFVPTIKNIIEK